ncbi:MAG TPA: cyclase family protein [Candidatus Limnocylindria bacterium]|nr:cyclase family protein [Candidatus Limnocylindria bacterium]
MADLPSEDEVLGYATTLSNWGRWGAEDERGTLNLIGDAERASALALARRGRVISLAWDISADPPGKDQKAPPQRYMLRTGQGTQEGEHPERQVAAAEYLGFVFHGRRITHLDAPAHLHWNGRMYNGHPSWLVNSEHGAMKNSVTVARDGIVTRGVLVDAPRHRNVKWLEPGEPVHRAELEAILAAEKIEVRKGDALFLRTGYGRSRIEEGPKWEGKQSGWGASCLPFFRERDVAVIGCDTSGETHPSGYKGFRGPIHGIGIAAIGLWLVDNANLEPLAATCAELGTWEFGLVLAPLPFAGATGSAMNPLALF